MITVKDLEVQKPPVDKWAEKQIQIVLSEITEGQKNGELPETLVPFTMFTQMGGYEAIGIWRINTALEKYNQESSVFNVFVEMTRANFLMITLSKKPESLAEKEVRNMNSSVKGGKKMDEAFVGALWAVCGVVMVFAVFWGCVFVFLR